MNDLSDKKKLKQCNIHVVIDMLTELSDHITNINRPMMLAYLQVAL